MINLEVILTIFFLVFGVLSFAPAIRKKMLPFWTFTTTSFLLVFGGIYATFSSNAFSGTPALMVFLIGGFHFLLSFLSRRERTPIRTIRSLLGIQFLSTLLWLAEDSHKVFILLALVLFLVVVEARAKTVDRQLIAQLLVAASILGLGTEFMHEDAGHALKFGFLIAAMGVQGVFPFHGGVYGAVKRGNTLAIIAFLVSQPGLAFVWEHLGSFSQEPALIYWLATGCLYIAIFSFGARRLLEWCLCFFVFQSSLIWLGVLEGGILGETAARLQVLTTAASSAVLFLLSWLIERRFGPVDRDVRASTMRAVPRFGTIFLLFLLAAINSPLLVGFVSEDLLVQTVIDHHLLAGIIVLFSITLISVSAYSRFSKSFLGGTRPHCPQFDLARIDVISLILFFVVGNLGFILQA